jgi:hypothetical protein
MNKIINLTAAFFLAFSLFSMNSASARSKNPPSKLSDNSSFCLEISGKVTHGKKLIKGKYKAELISNNFVISSATIKDNRSFKFLLNRNSSYLIKISKKGHKTRYVSVCTNMNTNRKQDQLYTLSFETELIGIKEALSLDYEAQELPVAIISFNKATEKFDNNKGYTAFVKQKIYAGN